MKSKTRVYKNNLEFSERKDLFLHNKEHQQFDAKNEQFQQNETINLNLLLSFQDAGYHFNLCISQKVRTSQTARYDTQPYWTLISPTLFSSSITFTGFQPQNIDGCQLINKTAMRNEADSPKNPHTVPRIMIVSEPGWRSMLPLHFFSVTFFHKLSL